MALLLMLVTLSGGTPRPATVYARGTPAGAGHYEVPATPIR
jgi:hypothetical protein